MALEITKKKKNPHLALTHNELQGGASNGRNVSLLMKSDVEITEDLAALIEKVSGVKVDVTKASYNTVREALNEKVKEKFKTDPYGWAWVEDFDESYVVFTNDEGLFYTTYSVSDGVVEVGDEAIEVSRVVNYVEGENKIILSDQMIDIESGVQSLIVKSFDSISKNEKLVDVFKSKLERGKQMEVEVQKAVDEATQVLKADLEKAQAELAKANEALEVLQKEKQEQKDSIRKEKIAQVVADKDQAEELFKATTSLEDGAFEVILKSFKDKVEQVENSDLFQRATEKTDIEKSDEEPMHMAILKKKFKAE